MKYQTSLILFSFFSMNVLCLQGIPFPFELRIDVKNETLRQYRFYMRLNSGFLDYLFLTGLLKPNGKIHS